jgi:hypothetical protein
MYFVLHRAVRGESGGEDFFFVGLQVNYRELQPNYRELQPNYRDYVTRAKLRTPPFEHFVCRTLSINISKMWPQHIQSMLPECFRNI